MIVIYAFSESRTFEWPPPGLHLDWFDKAFDNTGARDAFWYSVKTGLLATAVALVLGTLASLAVARYRFFGRETISFLVILPIALPGIVTGIALNSTFTQVLGIDLEPVHDRGRARDLLHRRRLQQRDRPPAAAVGLVRGGVGRPRRDAVADLPLVTLPNMRTALVAGALLAFALSFDEIIVTTFTIGAGDETLPIWILTNFSRPNQLPIVNVVAVFVILISIIPVYLAHRLTQDEGRVAPGRAAGPRSAGPRRPSTRREQPHARAPVEMRHRG